jgi:hypothetical protein
LELTGRVRRRASLSSRSAARVGATSPGVRRSRPGTLAGGRQLNAEPLGGVGRKGMLFLKLLPVLLLLALGLGQFALEHRWRDRRTRRYRQLRNSLVVLFVLSALASGAVVYREHLSAQRQEKRIEDLLTQNEDLSSQIGEFQADLDDAKFARLSGVIVPGNEAEPHHKCGPIPEDALKAFMGGNLHWFSRAEHVFVIWVGDVELLTLERSPSGYFVSALIFREEDDRPVARILRNRFELNRNNYFENRSHDRHELRVVDKNNREVLAVRFLNESTFVIRGIFHVPGRQTVIADTDSIRIDNVFGMSGGCVRVEGATVFKF